MNKRTIQALTYFINWIKAEVSEGRFELHVDPEVIVTKFSKEILTAKLIENMIDEDFKGSKEAFDDRRTLWNSLVIEATKRDWCKSPKDAINYANEVVEATL